MRLVALTMAARSLFIGLMISGIATGFVALMDHPLPI